MLVVHCVTHETNLPMQAFLKQPLVQKLERLLHLHIHLFFFFTQKVPWVMQTCWVIEDKREQVVTHIKTRWIYMLFPIKKDLEEYKPLVWKWTMISMLD
jgi:hypothetical protein